MTKKVLGISRSARFSPNSTDRDEAIFQGVVDELTRQGVEVERVCEDAFITVGKVDAVFSMARDPRVLEQLAALECKGLPIVNSPKALLRATRVALTEIFEQEGIPVPLSPVLFREEGGRMEAHSRTTNREGVHFPLWLKRSEACAQSAADVCFVENDGQLEAALQGYLERGIHEVLVSEHLKGDLVKFYGVEGTDFFHLYYPTSDNAFSKFGLEKINGAPSGFPLDVKALKVCADRAAALCGIPVYGGDGIVDEQGVCRLIDFNDWPSFSRCREQAAQAIAEKIIQQLEFGSAV